MNLDKIKEAFNAHPHIDTLYTTDEGKIYSKEDRAFSANGNKKPQVHQRTTVEAQEKLDEELAKTEDGDQTPAEDTPSEGEDLEVVELVKPTDRGMTKEQLADWLNDQDVEFDLSDTKAVLLEKAVAKYNELTKTDQ